MHRRARVLRQALTISERRLWNWLRNRTFGYKFRRQFPVRGYVIDFYCPELKLAVEVDGHHHGTPGMLQFDDRRSAELKALGIEVVRIQNVTLAKNPQIAEVQLRYAIQRRVEQLT